MTNQARCHFLVLPALAITGCAVDHPVTTFVGTTSNPDSFLAVSTDEVETTAYLCDGDPGAGTPDTAPGVATWLAGSGADLANAGTTLHATFGADTVSGTVTSSAATLTFELVATDGGDAGLYFADQTVNGARVVGGWIVLPDGEQRGAVNTGTASLIGPVLSPKLGSILIPSLGLLRVAPFDPRGFEGGGGLGMPTN